MSSRKQSRGAEMYMLLIKNFYSNLSVCLFVYLAKAEMHEVVPCSPITEDNYVKVSKYI